MQFEPPVRDRMLAGLLLPSDDYLAAQRFRSWIQGRLRRQFELGTRIFLHPPRGTAFGQITLNGIEATEVTPRGPVGDPLIFYIHGGAFILGSPRTHRAPLAHLAAHAGLRAILPRYRLGPELELSGYGCEDAFLEGDTLRHSWEALAELLRAVIDLAPPPSAWRDVDQLPRPVDAPFSGFVFKVQTGMDPAHRDRLAFMRVCSGRFERGAVLTNARSRRPVQTKYAQSVFGRERETIDEAYPGDVVGLVNAHALLVGDTLYDARPVTYPGLPRFTPEHFAVFTPRDAGRGKQFRRGIQMLDQEGIVQVLTSDRRGVQAPVLAAVGPMQFEVAAHRLEHEFGAPANQETLQYGVARRVVPEAAAVVNRQRGAEVLERTDGEAVALFNDKWRMRTIASELPRGSLPPMFGDDEGVGP